MEGERRAREKEGQTAGSFGGGGEQGGGRERRIRPNGNRGRRLLTVRLRATPARCANARVVPNELAANAIAGNGGRKERGLLSLCFVCCCGRERCLGEEASIDAGQCGKVLDGQLRVVIDRVWWQWRGERDALFIRERGKEREGREQREREAWSSSPTKKRVGASPPPPTSLSLVPTTTPTHASLRQE